MQSSLYGISTIYRHKLASTASSQKYQLSLAFWSKTHPYNIAYLIRVLHILIFLSIQSFRFYYQQKGLPLISATSKCGYVLCIDRSKVRLTQIRSQDALLWTFFFFSVSDIRPLQEQASLRVPMPSFFSAILIQPLLSHAKQVVTIFIPLHDVQR